MSEQAIVEGKCARALSVYVVSPRLEPRTGGFYPIPQADGILADEVKLTRVDVSLQGTSNTPAASAHHVRIIINSEFLTEANCNGTTPRTLALISHAGLCATGSTRWKSTTCSSDVALMLRSPERVEGLWYCR